MKPQELIDYENRAKDLILSEMTKDDNGYYYENLNLETDREHEPTVQEKIDEWVYGQLGDYEWFKDFYEAVKIYYSKTEAQNLWTEWTTRFQK